MYPLYRHDKKRQRRLTTVEIVVDDAPIPRVRRMPDDPTAPHPNSNVLLRIAYSEENLRQRVKTAGAMLLPERKLWQLPYRKALALQLHRRIVEA